MRHSIVVPTYNEADNMAELFRRIGESGLEDYEILIVDDHSPDGTYERALREAGGQENIRVLYNPGSRGLSPSIVYGFSQARGEKLICMDGDLQHDPAALPGLFKELDDHEFCIGSRYVDGGGFVGKWSPSRVIVSRTATYMARFILGVKVKDPMSGFFAVRRRTFLEVRPHLSSSGFKIMLEMLYRLSQLRGPEFHAGEHGIIFGKRNAGASKLSCKVIFEYLAMLIQLRRSTAR